MNTYLSQGFVKQANEIFYKGSDGNIYKGINPRGSYIDFEGVKSFKKVHSIGHLFREVSYQSCYKDKQSKIFFTLLE